MTDVYLFSTRAHLNVIVFMTRVVWGIMENSQLLAGAAN